MPPGVQLIHSGVGKINAALAAREAIQTLRPTLVVNFGTAGAVHAGAHGLLDIGRVIQRDMDAEPLAPRGVTPFAIHPPEIVASGAGVCCATGDSFVRGPDAWLHAQGVDVVDMELYAIAEVCRRAGVPWWGCKFVTDRADDNAGDDWMARASHGEPLFLQALARRLERQPR